MRHVLPELRHRAGQSAVIQSDWHHGYGYRDSTGPIRGPRTPGRCRWCGLATEPRGRRRTVWHGSCARWYAAARGQRVSAGGELVVPFPEEAVCQAPDCDEPIEPPGPGRSVRRGELDHIVALGIAARQGPDELARAVCLDNLWWICVSCHAGKTSADRWVMAEMDRRAGRRRGCPRRIRW